MEKEKKSKSSKKEKEALVVNKGGEGNHEEEFAIAPTSETPKLDTSRWPLLLKNYDQLHIRTAHYTPIATGMSPLRRTIQEYIRYGVINLDKPVNPSSHEVYYTILHNLHSIL